MLPNNRTILPGVPHYETLSNRRDFLARAGGGFGALAAACLLGQSPLRAADKLIAPPTSILSPLAPRPGHYVGKAKSVIFLFMEGGPSQIDLFDPKPKLNELHGKPLPESFGQVITAMGEYGAPLMGCKRVFKQYGQSGTWLSDWVPHHRDIVDDIAVIRSCHQDGINHAGGVCQMNTGVTIAGRPSLGAWVTYGLGTENQNLPAFVVLTDTNAQVVNGPRNWGAGFMPAVYQGTKAPSRSPTSARPAPSATRASRPSSASSRASTSATWPPAPTSPSWTRASRATSSPSACRPRPRKSSTSRANPPRRARFTAWTTRRPK
jgi:hypothetical protein